MQGKDLPDDGIDDERFDRNDFEESEDQTGYEHRTESSAANEDEENGSADVQAMDANEGAYMQPDVKIDGQSESASILQILSDAETLEVGRSGRI